MTAKGYALFVCVCAHALECEGVREWQRKFQDVCPSSSVQCAIGEENLSVPQMMGDLSAFLSVHTSVAECFL